MSKQEEDLSVRLLSIENSLKQLAIQSKQSIEKIAKLELN